MDGPDIEIENGEQKTTGEDQAQGDMEFGEEENASDDDCIEPVEIHMDTDIAQDMSQQEMSGEPQIDPPKSEPLKVEAKGGPGEKTDPPPSAPAVRQNPEQSSVPPVPPEEPAIVVSDPELDDKQNVKGTFKDWNLPLIDQFLL